MKEKGFTLIELLAVIIILSIIALIAVPVVSNIITNSKIAAAKDSALAVLRAAQVYYGNGEITGTFSETRFKCDGKSCKKCTNTDCTTTDASTILKFEGIVPTDGIIKITDKGKTYIEQVLYYADNKTYVGYDSTGNIKGSSIETEVLTNAEANGAFVSCITTNDCEYGSLIGSEIKFDPVNNTICTTGTTCYTWNVIGYNGKSADIMMNENLGTGMYWSSCTYIDDAYNCVNTPTTVNMNLSSRTSTWSYVARIISKEELESILDVNIVSTFTSLTFSSNGNGFLSLDPEVATVEFRYSDNYWLYANLSSTTSTGYWTGSHSGFACSTPADNVVCNKAWLVYAGYLGKSYSHIIKLTYVWNENNSTNYGIRPVITIAKTLLN